ncbi:MAG: hypothetical protein AAGG06_14070 [Pseudomonadota bacterium]
MLILLMGSSAAAAAQERHDTLIALNGVAVPTPVIKSLDCAEMASLLDQIDLSGYRSSETVAESHPDRPIFEYENQLTQAHYYECTLGDNQLADPAEAFSHGFD